MCVGARPQIKMSSLRTWFTTTSAKIKVIKHVNEEPREFIHKDLKDIVTTVRSMDIDILNANLNPCGNLKIGKDY